MSGQDRWSCRLFFLLPLVGTLAFGGCAQKPCPPVFSLYGYQRLAVIPFDNQTRDPKLAADVAEEMTNEVVQVNAVPVIQASQVAAFLRASDASPSDLLTNDPLRKGLGRKFQCDILLMGSADAYVENLKDTSPQRAVVDDEDKWGFYTYRKATVNASAKLVDVASGSLLWSNKNRGYSWRNTFNPLPMPADQMLPAPLQGLANLVNLVRYRVLGEGDDEPVTIDQNDPNVLVYPKSRCFTELREKAIDATVSGMVCDFQGRYGWTPQLKGDAQ